MGLSLCKQPFLAVSMFSLPQALLVTWLCRSDCFSLILVLVSSDYDIHTYSTATVKVPHCSDIVPILCVM